MKTQELLTIKHDLFKPPFLEIKKDVYKAKQRIEANYYAQDKFINGFEIIAEKQLPNDIEAYNNLVEKLNNRMTLIRVVDKNPNDHHRYSNY